MRNAFILGIALSSLVVKSVHRRRGVRAARMLYLLQTVLLAVFLAAGLQAVRTTTVDSPWVLATGALGATAMGVQNAHARLVKRAGISTTVMTGNVMQAVLDGIDLRFGGSYEPAEKRVVRERFMARLPALLGFAIGATGGALSHARVSLWALLLPLALLLFMAWRAGRPSMTTTP
nr:YoaK family protein [Caballeronia sordidicola]